MAVMARGAVPALSLQMPVIAELAFLLDAHLELILGDRVRPG